MNIERIKEMTQEFYEKKGLNRYITDQTAQELLDLVRDNIEIEDKVDQLLKSLGQSLSGNEKAKNKLVTRDNALKLLRRIDQEVV
jgi:hypothetical protein